MCIKSKQREENNDTKFLRFDFDVKATEITEEKQKARFIFVPIQVASKSKY